MSREASLHLPQRGGRAARAPHYDVVIIGGGYAGVVAAIHLLRRASPPRLAIIEPSVRLGRGVAYATRLSCHLLNTRAKHMSLRNDDDQHYTRWAQARAQARSENKDTAPRVDENSFTPRGWFGDYVGQELNVAVNQAGATFTHLRYSAMYCEQVERGLWSIGLSDGRCLYAPLVILAVWNTPRRTGGFPGLRSPDARVVHAWDLQSRPPRPDADVLIVGTGLSMVDALLTLERHDHRGHIHAVSRHGLIPQAHSDNHGCCEPLTSVGLRALVRELRGSVEEDRRAGRPWQWRMDAARHQAQALWRGLTILERQRFLRHARSYWDAHRHRIAPEVALQLHALKNTGRLTINKGGIGEIRATSAPRYLRSAGGDAAGS